MSWVRLDDHFPEHPKVLALGEHYHKGISLQVRALCYCAANLTDGFVPTRKFQNETRLVQRLVEVGLWEQTDGGYLIHDYLEYNPSKDEVLALRKTRSDAGRLGASSRWGMAKPMANAIASVMAKPMANAWQTDGKTMPPPLPLIDQEQHAACLLGESGAETRVSVDGNPAPGNGFSLSLPECMQMPSTLTGYPRDVSVSQAVLLQLQRTWPVMSQADISAFCAIARDTCLPDCEPTHRQCHECALLITWVLRERTDGRPWRSCKGLLRTILTEDRKVAAP